MNILVVLYIESYLLMILSGFMSASTILSFIYNENDFIPLLISTLLTFIVGFILYITLRKKINLKNVGAREGFGTVTFG